jgi:hypothetical protein
LSKDYKTTQFINLTELDLFKTPPFYELNTEKTEYIYIMTSIILTKLVPLYIPNKQN